jgi:5-methylthioadenosine/S-adenosylhomocysteine deaminase
MIVYEADWICPVTAAPTRNAWIAVEGDRIASVGTGAPPAGVRHIHYAGCAILPGFVNAHAHLELTLFQGLLGNLTFADWIARLVHIKYQRCTRDAFVASAQLGAAQMLRAGVTAVGEVMDIGTGWDAMLQFGLQGVAYQEVFGPAEGAAVEAMAGLSEKVARYRRQETATQRVGVSPHAPYTVSRKLFEEVREFARREGLRMTSHLAESREETAFVQDGAGPFAEAHRKRGIEVVARKCSPVAYLDREGLLGPDMLLVHAIEVDRQDLERVRETGSFVVHCPRSNSYLRHRVAPVAEMRARGIPVSLGTDSVASNESFDMFEEMRAVVEQQKMSCDDALRMATIEGARALGLEKDLGSLEAGKRADFLVVRIADVIEPVKELVSRAKVNDIVGTFLGGREARVEVEELQDEVRRVQMQLRG